MKKSIIAFAGLFLLILDVQVFKLRNTAGKRVS